MLSCEQLVHRISQQWCDGDRLHVSVQITSQAPHVPTLVVNNNDDETKSTTADTTIHLYQRNGVPYEYFEGMFKCISQTNVPVKRSHEMIDEYVIRPASLLRIKSYHRQSRWEMYHMIHEWVGTCEKRPHIRVFVQLIRLPTTAASHHTIGQCHTPTRVHLIEKWSAPPYLFEKVATSSNHHEALRSHPNFHVALSTTQQVGIPDCVYRSIDFFQRANRVLQTYDVDHECVEWSESTIDSSI